MTSDIVAAIQAKDEDRNKGTERQSLCIQKRFTCTKYRYSILYLKQHRGQGTRVADLITHTDVQLAVINRKYTVLKHFFRRIKDYTSSLPAFNNSNMCSLCCLGCLGYKALAYFLYFTLLILPLSGCSVLYISKLHPIKPSKYL